MCWRKRIQRAIPDDFLKSIREEDPSVEVVVDLSDNFITDLSSSLTTFTNMNLVLVDSDTTSPAPEELCDTDHNGWVAGMVGQVRNGGALNACDAILCPPGLHNKDGRLSITRGCDRIEKATHLKTLHLSSTLIDNMEDADNAPDSLINLHLAECQFKDEIPPEFYKLSNLKIAYLNFNRFSGTLPEAIGQMTNLEEFWAYNNDVTGPIPEQLGSLTYLTVLALDENKLSGCILTELEQFSATEP